MKMSAYYVVFDEGDSCDYVAGPFRFYNEAYEYNFNNGLIYNIVIQETEVK